MLRGLSAGPNPSHPERGTGADHARVPEAHRFWTKCAVYAAIFIALFAWFFLTSSRGVYIYDEGLELTAAMRVAAGQVIHRDFYYNYGPAMVYLLAGLFKVFGQSVLIERLLWTADIAAGGVGIFILARRLAAASRFGVSKFRPATWATAALLLSVLWGESLGLKTLFTVWSTWLLLPVFTCTLRRRRALAAGIVTGVATLFRYDTGAGLAAVQVLIIALACWLAQPDARRRMRATGSALWPYLLGFAIPVAPLFIAYAAVGAIHDFLYDIVLYPAKYYHAARNLPFPRIHRQNFQDSVVYILPVLIAFGLYAALRWYLPQRREDRRRIPEWVGATLAFAAVGTVMYLKGLVRIGAGQLFMALSPCILLALVLWMHRGIFATVERALLAFVLLLFAVAGIFPTLHDLQNEHRQRSSMLAWILDPAGQNPRPPFDAWCREHNVVSKGFCFFPDNDHIQAIEYIDQHTRPGDTLYVGLPQHARININDNFTYFATQRLPATKWSHFDPFLQNRADTQQEMIGELEKNRPPYVVLDSEFEDDREPNGSSVNTGVHLLDDYIRQHYGFADRFGEMTILKRK